MKSFSFVRSNKGFSLVELMIVVGIIGILATLALPRFKQFQAKAKMGEAKNILSHIYTLEQSYSLDNNTFIVHALIGRTGAGALQCAPDAGAQAIGFRIDPCNAGAPVPRYGYTTAAGAAGIGSSFTATAATGAAANNLVCPGNGVINHRISETNTFTEPTIGAACPN